MKAESAGDEDVRCFVIGPIGDRDAPDGSEEKQRYEDALQVFARIIKPACEAVGLEPVRADKLSRSGDITEQICRRLRDDDVVIADVTDANPNVMYELGLRHSRNLLTIQIGERGRLPFDISVVRTTLFVRDEYGLIEAREQVKAMLEAGLAGNWDPVTATRVWLESAVTAEGGGEAPVEAEVEEEGFLEILADTEEAMPRMVEYIERAAEILQEMGTLAVDSTPRMEQASTAGAKLLAANSYAQQLEPKAEALEETVGLFADVVKRVDRGVRYLLGKISSGDIADDERAAAPDFLQAIVDMGVAAGIADPGTKNVADAVLQTAKATRRLRGPANRIARALTRYSETSQLVVDWGDQAQAVLAGLAG